MEDVNDNSTFVIIGGQLVYEIALPTTHTHNPTEWFDQIAAKLEKLVAEGGLFEHKAPNGVQTYLKLVAGSPVQILPGKVFKQFMREQRVNQLMQHSTNHARRQ